METRKALAGQRHCRKRCHRQRHYQRPFSQVGASPILAPSALRGQEEGVVSGLIKGPGLSQRPRAWRKHRPGVRGDPAPSGLWQFPMFRGRCLCLKSHSLSGRVLQAEFRFSHSEQGFEPEARNCQVPPPGGTLGCTLRGCNWKECNGVGGLIPLRRRRSCGWRVFPSHGPGFRKTFSSGWN